MVCHIELFVLRWLASFLAIMELLSNSPALTVDCANNEHFTNSSSSINPIRPYC